MVRHAVFKRPSIRVLMALGGSTNARHGEIPLPSKPVAAIANRLWRDVAVSLSQSPPASPNLSGKDG
jgi:hypothetical protein